MKFKDMTGLHFHRLIVLSRAANRNGQAWWTCKCECGKEVNVFGRSLRNGDTKSCGCLSRDRTIARNTKHGASLRQSVWTEYRIWQGMIKRCTNPSSHQYSDYGGRGIKVCKRWLTFANFIDDMGRKPEGLTLERVNNDGDYQPNNCKWADRKAQSRNSRHNHVITFLGKTQTLVEWSEQTGIKQSTLGERLNRYGWPVERALTEPVRRVNFV